MTRLNLELATAPATEFKPYLPGDGLGPRADAALRSLARYGFMGASGLFLEQAAPMIAAANSPEIADNCPNDVIKRVGSVPIMKDWMGGGRAPSNLHHVNIWSGKPLTPDDVARLSIADVTQDTLMWASVSKEETTERKVTGATYTTAYRTFPAAKEVLRQRVPYTVRLRLGLLGATIMLSDLIGRRGVSPNDLSLEANFDNPALSMYEELGFVEVRSAREPYTRPTIKQPGEVVNGNVVRHQKDEQGRVKPGKYEVDAVRTFWRLRDWEL